MTDNSPPSTGQQRSKKLDRALQTEKLQLRLLMLEEKYRGQVMKQQVEAFEEKVYLSFQNFNIELLVSMIQILRYRINPRQEIVTLKALHKAVVKEATRQAGSRKREARDLDGKPIGGEDGCVKYFMWFFEYLDYIRDLKVNFTERIFQPLFKYFYEGSSGSDGKRRGSSSTSTLSFSKLSQFSLDSGGSSDKFDDVDDLNDNVTTARQRAQEHAALMLLSNEFTDIKTLYDTSEVDKVAQRMSLVKEQMDFLLDNEDSLDPDIYSPESERLMFNLDLDDDATETLVRFIPDVLIKFQKSAWLARRWLQLDSVRTKDLNKKLEKILELEKKLNKRMSLLDEEIQKNEEELEKDMIELQNLLKREERSSDLGLTIFDLDERITGLHKKIEKMRKDRDDMTARILEAIKNKNRRQYDELKVLYETNRLHRYVIERQLGTLSFHRDIAEQDMRVELSIKPSLIHQTNSLQDQCEQLEQVITRDKNQKHTIKTALVPIAEDRKVISERLHQQRVNDPPPDYTMAQYIGSTGRRNPAGQAKFVKTHRAVATHIRSYRPTSPEW